MIQAHEIQFEITEQLKERFCKDCKIPITIFKEPYFSARMELLDPYYDSKKKWVIFYNELSKYNCAQDYFEEYNRVKDTAMEAIQSSTAYAFFNGEDMSRYQITHVGLPGKDIYKYSNNGKNFISIDMKKANFSSLQHYSEEKGFIGKNGIFEDAQTWDEFLHKFTDNEHIVNSKYIRQVILGNCNPKRHITYEKYLMDLVLTKLEPTIRGEVVFFSNDEIVLDITHLSKQEQITETDRVTNLCKEIAFPLRVELFTLRKIEGTRGYLKEIY